MNCRHRAAVLVRGSGRRSVCSRTTTTARCPTGDHQDSVRGTAREPEFDLPEVQLPHGVHALLAALLPWLPRSFPRRMTALRDCRPATAATPLRRPPATAPGSVTRCRTPPGLPGGCPQRPAPRGCTRVPATGPVRQGAGGGTPTGPGIARSGRSLGFHGQSGAAWLAERRRHAKGSSVDHSLWGCRAHLTRAVSRSGTWAISRFAARSLSSAETVDPTRIRASPVRPRVPRTTRSI